MLNQEMKSSVNKPWGSFKILDKGDNFLVKKIYVKSFCKLSLQSHINRSEHWVVVKGIADVILNQDKIILKQNQGIFIPKKTKHRLINNQKTDLILIEVWYGDNLSEEDIIRYEDDYGRK